MPSYYDYSTQTLQKQQLEELIEINQNINDLSSCILLLAFIFCLSLLTSFARNIF